MAQSTQIQAACLLLLLIASLTSSTLLQQMPGQPEALQPWHRTEARTGMSVLIPNRKKRDSNFPICIFCCKCCKTDSCGICCKT